MPKKANKKGKRFIDGRISAWDKQKNDFVKLFFWADLGNGFVSATDGKKFGVLDKNYNIVGKIEFTFIGKFKNGFAIVKKEGKLGYINENGEILGDNLWFPYVYPFDKNGYAKVAKSLDEIYIINTKG